MTETLLGISGFPTKAFDHHIESFYPLAIALLERTDLGGVANVELRGAVAAFLRRVGEVRFALAGLGLGVGVGGGRRGSAVVVVTPLSS